MTHGYNREFREPRIVVRETDDYVERRTDGSESPEGPPAGPRVPWHHTVLQPGVVAILTACVVWPVAQFIPTVAPGLNATLLWTVPVLMALVGFTTQRRVHRELVSGTEATRFWLIELGVLFLLVKVISHLDNTVPEMAAIISGWAAAPLTFFDGETMVTFLLGTAAWWNAGATARDFDAVSDPSLYIGETGPRVRLVNRYFLGGGLLMFFAALTRVSVIDVVTFSQARSRRPVVSALIYFLVGLVMLGVVRFTRLVRLWQRDRVVIAEKLSGAWLRYLLIRLAGVSLVAFLLPTGYTIGLLDLVSMVVAIVAFIMLLIYSILMWPLTLLMRLLMGQDEAPPPPAAPRMPLQPDFVPSADGGGAFWEVLRSVLFWVVLVAGVVYLVRSYLRDRPDLWRAVQRITPARWARSGWQALRRWVLSLVGKLQRTVATALPALTERIRRRRERAAARCEATAAGPTPRAQMMYHYLQTLAAAKAKGYPRRGSDTPYEYEARLVTRLREDGPALEALTAGFVVARYSDHPVTEADVAQQAENAARVVRGLETTNRTDDHEQ